MKITVIENTKGLFERFPHRDIEIHHTNHKTKDYGTFYDISDACDEPLWGSTVTEESPFIRSFDDI